VVESGRTIAEDTTFIEAPVCSINGYGNSGFWYSCLKTFTIWSYISIACIFKITCLICDLSIAGLDSTITRSIWVFSRRGKTCFSIVIESIIHPSTVASIIWICIARNELLFREIYFISTSLNVVGDWNGTSSRESPTWTTTLLIFNSRNVTLLNPIPAGGSSNTCSFENFIVLFVLRN